MLENRKMTNGNIDAKLRRFLKQHVDEMTIASREFTPKDVLEFEVNISESFQGKDQYSFMGKTEFINKNGITNRIPIKGDIYIEEGEDNEPKFSKLGIIYTCY